MKLGCKCHQLTWLAWLNELNEAGQMPKCCKSIRRHRPKKKKAIDPAEAFCQTFHRIQRTDRNAISLSVKKRSGSGASLAIGWWQLERFIQTVDQRPKVGWLIQVNLSVIKSAGGYSGEPTVFIKCPPPTPSVNKFSLGKCFRFETLLFVVFSLKSFVRICVNHQVPSRRARAVNILWHTSMQMSRCLNNV